MATGSQGMRVCGVSPSFTASMKDPVASGIRSVSMFCNERGKRRGRGKRNEKRKRERGEEEKRRKERNQYGSL